MQNVLIDTDIAIDYLRGSREARDLIGLLWEEDRAYLSILSVYELYAGMRPPETDATQKFIDACHLDSVTLDIAGHAGEMYRHWRTKGLTLTSIDCLIAATALVNDRRIATKNKNHYPRKGLLL